MLESLSQKLLELTFGDRLFRAALLAFYFLVALAGLLVIASALLHWYSNQRQKRLQQREAQWKPLLMEVLSGTTPP